jgi:predicted secreted protein with PEFG-CTERM motif
MIEEKARKIFFAMMFFSLSALILSFYDNNIGVGEKSSAFAQTTNLPTDNGANSPIPEDNSTDIGNGPIPEDNSANSDNSINPAGSGSDNLTNSGLPNDTSPVNDTVYQGPIQTNPPSIPEFGSFASVILIIAVSSMILFRRKLSI